ncbi:hypothetical protein TNCV_2157691 [Trichonephila clavipes]|nr:hypothetical protein TNCV_2157691 [Trichonephila clavipes]
MIRWALKLSEFNIEWEHRTGVQNVVADVLSRNPVGNMDGSQISCAALRALALNSKEKLIREQREDPEVEPREFSRRDIRRQDKIHVDENQDKGNALQYILHLIQEIIMHLKGWPFIPAIAVVARCIRCIGRKVQEKEIPGIIRSVARKVEEENTQPSSNSVRSGEIDLFDICWYSYEIIEILKTAQTLVRKENVEIKRRFVMGCKYYLEHHAQTFRNSYAISVKMVLL